MTTALSVDEVRALPAMPPLWPDAAAAVGVGRTLAYALADAGEFPVPVVKVGRSLKVRRADLLAFLGIVEANGDGVPTAIGTPLAETHPSTSAN